MKRRVGRPRGIIAAVAMAALLAACGAGATGSPGPSSASLEGRTFLSTAIEGRALVPGSQVRLSFKDGRIGASAGCNSMAGRYAVEGDRLVMSELGMTEMACDAALMAQDQWLAGFLDGAGIALAGDTLTLTKGGVRLTLLDRRVADPDRPLLGTRWVVDGLMSGDVASSVPVGVIAALTFSAGRVRVEAGCNTGDGTATVADGTITFGSIGLTKVHCGDAAMAVERAVTSVLAGTVSYTIEAASMTLRGNGGGLLLHAAS